MTTAKGPSAADLGKQSPVIEEREYISPSQAEAASPKPSLDTNAGQASTDVGAPRTVTAATAAYTAARAGDKRPWWHSQLNLMLAVFGLLVATALLFVMLAPAPELQLAASKSETSPPSLADSTAPWSQSQLAEARAASQDILENLLDSKKSLEQKGVLLWAPERYQEALDLALQGDEAYKQQDFAAAQAKYKAAVAAMDSLFELLPRLISSRLSAGREALRTGKSALAKEHFNKVLQLDSGNLDAAAGLDHAQRLDQVLALLVAAEQDEAAYAEGGQLSELQAAESKLQQAVDLYGEYQPAVQNLQRVRAEIVDKRFKLAMTEAYQALFANRYNAARAAFAKALQIKPGEQAAARAMQQALAADQTSSISSLLANAKRFEQQEEWASARSNYQTVLQRDPNQVAAKLGEIRSAARLQLDNEMTSVLADSLALSRKPQRQKAESVLQEARAITVKGARLNGQIERLSAALGQLDTAIKVAFQSNELTAVTLQKIGSKAIKLGQFSQKNLSLKPGRYVATGVRLGYRDVRQDIELLPGAEGVQVFTIQCEQAVRSSAAGS